jgi:hypothetical protein
MEHIYRIDDDVLHQSKDRKAARLSSKAMFIRSSHFCLSRRTGALGTASRARKKISSGLWPSTC